MQIKFTGTTVSIMGVMVALGELPDYVTRQGIKMPLVWNDITPWLKLLGIMATLLAFYAAKGRDDHSLPAQVEAAGAKQIAEQAMKQASAEPVTPTQVEIVDDDLALASREKAAQALAQKNAEIERLRKILSGKTPPE